MREMKLNGVTVPRRGHSFTVMRSNGNPIRSYRKVMPRFESVKIIDRTRGLESW